MNNNLEFTPLLVRVLAGDELAMEPLFLQLRPYLHLLARHQLGEDMRGRREDSDLVQETLVRIIEGLKPGSPGRPQEARPDKFLAWVNVILRNVITDLVRREHAEIRDRRRTVAGADLFETLTRGSTSEQQADRAERAVRVASALARLPEHRRQIIVWRVFEGLDYAEIARRTGRSEGALRVAFLRAVEALRECSEIRGLLGDAS